MSLRQNTLIEITQVPNDSFPDRTKRFILDFVNYGEINTSWQNLTDTAKLRFPRNVLVEDENGDLINWTDNAIYGDHGNSSPLFMRGDEISISVGYFYDQFDDTEILEMTVTPQFTGYISNIKNRLPIELECEDNMWKLKQIAAPNKLYKASQYTVKKMIEEMLVGTPYTVTDGGFEVSIGDFRVQSETVAQVLERLKKDGGLTSYFRGNELRAATVAYDFNYMQTQEVFEFQENIISDSLEYTRKDDLNIAVRAYSQAMENATGKNHDGTQKRKRKRLEVLVGKIDKFGNLGEIVNNKTFHGDLITFPVIGATTKEQLIDRAKKHLPKFYYTGFRGSFDTFGQPTVTHGNAAIIRDNKIPERNGTYLIKQVTTKFGVQGFRQKIALHTRIDQGFTISDLNAGVTG